MATGKDTFRRNGYVLSWASSLAKVDNDEFYGFNGIDVEEKIERAMARGMERGGPPLGITRGQYSVEGSTLKGRLDTMTALMEKLAQKSTNGKSYGEKPFFFSLQYIENDLSITEEYHECYLSGRKLSASPGPDALIYEMPITIMYVKLNTPNIQGMTLFDNRHGRY